MSNECAEVVVVVTCDFREGKNVLNGVSRKKFLSVLLCVADGGDLTSSMHHLQEPVPRNRIVAEM